MIVEVIPVRYYIEGKRIFVSGCRNKAKMELAALTGRKIPVDKKLNQYYCINYIIQAIYHAVFRMRPPALQGLGLWKTKGENV